MGSRKSGSAIVDTRANLRPWKKGQSGNPSGRPSGLAYIEQELRKQCLPNVVTAMLRCYQLGMEGDVGALKLFLERLMGPARALRDPAPADAPLPAGDIESVRAAVVALIGREVAALTRESQTRGLSTEEWAALTNMGRLVLATSKDDRAALDAAIAYKSEEELQAMARGEIVK